MDTDSVVIKDAYISECEKYRYSLTRDWHEEFPVMLFIMLNPSVADHCVDDPTIRRCIEFAKREDMGGIEVVNLFAYRATSPEDMKAADDPVGPENDEIIREALMDVGTEGMVVCAWGNHGAFRGRSKEVLAIIREMGYTPLSIGKRNKNGEGEPKHPLYIKGDTPFMEIK